MPAMPLIGVRISWLIRARKRDLAAFASSATAFSDSASAASRSCRRSSDAISHSTSDSAARFSSAAPPIARSMRRQSARKTFSVTVTLTTSG